MSWFFVTKVDSEYQDTQGNWVPCNSSGIGSKSGYYNYNWSRAPYNIPFSKKDSTLSALRADITIKNANQADRNRRVHSSLPYPLHVRFTMTDNNSKTTKLTVLCYHENTIESIIAQKDKKEKDAGSPFDLWVTCDDVPAIHRVYIGGYHHKEEHQYRLATAGSSQYITQDTLYGCVWKAIKEKRSEFSLGFPSKKEGDPWSIEVFVLIDLENKHPYGLHVVGKTSSSSVSVYKMLPSDL